MEMNSEKYWENRFKTDWKEVNGGAQTLIHYEALIDYLPDWMEETIKTNNYSICDMGCGMGEGTNELHKHFPNSKVYGMDFSQTAVDDAAQTFPAENLIYFKGDFLNCDEKFDVIVTSHTLEHFKNPFEIVEKLSPNCKYFIITVPFREKPLWREHEFSFDYSSFPLHINEKELIYFSEIAPMFYPAGNYVMREQILVIYANKDLNENFTLKDLNSYYDETLNLEEEIEKLKKDKKKLKKRNKKLKKQNEHFKSTKAYKIWMKYANLKKKLFNR